MVIVAGWMTGVIIFVIRRDHSTLNMTNIWLAMILLGSNNNDQAHNRTWTADPAG